ncbi:MAG TPA: Gfo/Idh/MocA family oxidoreductase [Gammaproteobacteria bacterium]|nr:MAG: hypothetical protein A3E83_06705 [Gammaproteobacteria bacterium RIFCSPHIGHO2_12_FULL_41_20]HLB43551.1 Gfo/Idh/MocA family oxidoreductase [Gammaproteobacteria bacterium]
MRCLIIGYGSIGKKHTQILKNLGCDVSLVTSQKKLEYKYYSTIEEALEKKHFDYIIISNPTHKHYEALIKLIQYDYRGIVLVEKPLFSTAMPLSKNNIAKILVAYNLRFHELLNHAKKLIRDEKLLTFSAYVGSYLPAWRQKIDYQNCYSAKKEYGGGALRDLSHELDCCIWFCGPSLELTSLGGHFSPLEITSDDSYSILMKNTHCPMANLQMNYLDRHPHRNIIINTTHQSLFIDLINGLLYVNGNIIINSAGISETYIKQHLAVLNGEFDNFCDYEHGLYLVKLIDIIEYANISQTWVKV